MSVINKREKILRGAFAAALLSTSVFAASPTIKVDLDISGRKSDEVTEPNWIPWAIPEVNSKDTTIGGVKFTLTKGSVGKSLRTTWNKVNVQSPVYAKLVFTRNIGVTQGVAWKAPVPSVESSSSVAESSSSAAEELSSSEKSSSSEGITSLDGVTANAGLRMNVSGNIVFIAGLVPNSKIAVTDMNGRILYVRNASGNTTAIDLNAFGRGLYLVNVRGTTSGMAKSGAGLQMNKSVKVQVR